ncbi:MAG: adenylate kinase [Candidatus Zixiibacteriota bacterium]
MNLILLGVPGSGKGTLAGLLTSELRIPRFSPGDILRGEVRRKSQLGEQARPFMEKGELVPDGIILMMMEKRVDRQECDKGFILDGFPRTVVQAERLEQVLAESKKAIDFALKFEVSEQTVIRRLGGRRICSACGADFNLYTKPPEKVNTCDLCGGKLFQREDDKEEVITKRLEVYREQTMPIEKYYDGQGKLIRLDAEPEPEVVLKEVLRMLEAK